MSKMETNDSPDAEFKAPGMRVLGELRGERTSLVRASRDRKHEHMKTEMENVERSQSEMKTRSRK